MSVRPLRRLALAGAAGAAVLLAFPAAAGAHVEAEGTTVEGVTTVELSFHHGCAGAATTSLRVQLPEGATDVAPEDPAGWTSEVSGGELTWTGGTVPDSEEATFAVSMVLVEPEGTTVFLPTIQGCGDAENAWIDKSDDPEAENAAPRIVVGAAVATTGHDEDEGGHGEDLPGTVPEKTTNEAGEGTAITATADEASNTAAPATENASSSSSSNAPLIVGIIAAIVVLGGAAAFFVTRKSSSDSSSSADPSS